MERGVDTTINKQRGRFFDVKRRPFHGKETPSSIERRRFFHFKILLPLYLSGIGVHVNGTIHAPLHSERGKGVRLLLHLIQHQNRLFAIEVLLCEGGSKFAFFAREKCDEVVAPYCG